MPNRDPQVDAANPLPTGRQGGDATAETVGSVGSNEGEGSRSAARAYNAGAALTAKDPAKVEKLAREAAEELDREEGHDLRLAEQAAKSHDNG